MHLSKKQVVLGILIPLSFATTLLVLELTTRVSRKVDTVLSEMDAHKDTFEKFKEYLINDEKMRAMAIKTSRALLSEEETDKEKSVEYKENFKNYLDEKGIDQESIKIIIKEIIGNREGFKRYEEYLGNDY